MRRRIYTVGEANRTLPYVRAIVEEICERYATVESLTRRLGETSRDERDARERLRASIREEASRLHACSTELKQIGIQLKDYEIGLIDFPAMLDGRAILLCWKRGEGSVSHWHDAETGYAGRRPVPDGASDWPVAVSASPASRG